MVSHLVLARETIRPPPMAVRVVAVDEGQRLAVVDDLRVALQVRVPFKTAAAGALGVEADVLSALR